MGNCLANKDSPQLQQVIVKDDEDDEQQIQLSNATNKSSSTNTLIPFTFAPNEHEPRYLKQIKKSLKQCDLILNNNIPQVIVNEITMYFYPKFVEEGMVFFGRGRQYLYGEQEYSFLMFINKITDIVINDKTGSLTKCNVNAVNIWPEWSAVCNTEGSITVDDRNHRIHFSFVQVSLHPLTEHRNIIIPSYFEMEIIVPFNEEIDQDNVQTMDDYLNRMRMNGLWSQSKPDSNSDKIVDGEIFSYRIEKLFQVNDIEKCLNNITYFKKVPSIHGNMELRFGLQTIEQHLRNII